MAIIVSKLNDYGCTVKSKLNFDTDSACTVIKGSIRTDTVLALLGKLPQNQQEMEFSITPVMTETLIFLCDAMLLRIA